MLARRVLFVSQMAKSRYRILLKRDYLPLMNSPISTTNTNISERKRAFKRSHVNTLDFNQIMKEEQILNLDMNIFAKKDVKLMLEPFNYQQAMPKESIRSHLIKGFNYWMNLPDDVIKTVEDLSEIYYEIIIMLDDLYDQSDYRRGLPAGYKIFGASLTQVSGNACLFLIMKKLIELNNMKAIEAYVETFLKFCIPAYKEIYNRQNMICPTMNEYKQSLCIDKGSGILGFPIKLMQLFTDCKADYSELLNLLCLHQIYQNDLSNLCEEKCWDAKGFCDDISEGKYTLAAIHAINSGTLEGDVVFNIYRQKTKDLPTLKYCLSLMEKLGSIDFAKKATVTVENKLREEIKKFGGNPPLTKYIDTICSWGYEENLSKH